MRIRTLLAAACIVFAASLAAQKPAPQPQAPATPANKSHGPEVLLTVSVHDKHGFVSGLGPADFTLTEDGRPQTIVAFTRETSLPFRIGLMVDTGRALSNDLDAERKAATKFVHLLLPTDSPADAPATHKADQAFLLHFDREVELLEDFTGSSTKLLHEVDDMGPSRAAHNDRQDAENSGDNNGNSGNNGGNGGRGNNRGSGRSGAGSGSTLYDAIFLASDELMKTVKGRKALVVFSDGVDRNSKETLSDAIDAADRAGVEIFTIYLKGEEERGGNGMGGNQGGRRGGMGGGWPGGGGYPGGGGGYPGGGGSGRRGGGDGGDTVKVDGKKIMEQIATRTGGSFFEAKKKDNLEEIYGQIMDELKNQYLLTYTPDKAPDGEYHKVLLKGKKDDWTVTTREGYYAAEK
jgi:VWFA-related protein